MSTPTPPIALVTGASSGIGEAAAIQFAKQGWHVILIARTESKLTAVQEKIRSVGGQATVAAVDGADGTAVLTSRRTQTELGLFVIVNSAGMGAWK